MRTIALLLSVFFMASPAFGADPAFVDDFSGASLNAEKWSVATAFYGINGSAVVGGGVLTMTVTGSGGPGAFLVYMNNVPTAGLSAYIDGITQTGITNAENVSLYVAEDSVNWHTGGVGGPTMRGQREFKNTHIIAGVPDTGDVYAGYDATGNFMHVAIGAGGVISASAKAGLSDTWHSLSAPGTGISISGETCQIGILLIAEAGKTNTAVIPGITAIDPTIVEAQASSRARPGPYCYPGGGVLRR